MTRRPPRLRPAALLLALGLAVAATTVPGGSASATTAAATTSITRTAANVPGFCSQAGGLEQNLNGTVTRMRLTVSPASPRARSLVRVTVAVLQDQTTPPGQYYPAGFLRGEVVVGLSRKGVTKLHTLAGPANRRPVTGDLFPRGWVAKGSFKAPAKGKYKVTVQRIAYNVYGGGSRGGWSKPYAGFDLVCSGGLNPTAVASPYAHPRLTWTVRKHL